MKTKIIITFILSILLLFLGINWGGIIETEKFNKQLLINDGYYWMDASGYRAYAPLEECRTWLTENNKW